MNRPKYNKNRKSIVLRSSSQRKRNVEKPSGTPVAPVSKPVKKKRVVGPSSAKKKITRVFKKKDTPQRFGVVSKYNSPKSKYFPTSASKWINSIKGEPAFILGNGPSISDYDLTLLDDFFTLGTNRIFLIYDPTVLIWQDKQIHTNHRKEVDESKSIKICRNIYDKRKEFFNFELKLNPYKFGENTDLLHGRGNTGVLAAQLAVAMGCSSLVLLGTDCSYAEDGRTDFWGKNKDHRKYTLRMCNIAMTWLFINVAGYNSIPQGLYSIINRTNIIDIA